MQANKVNKYVQLTVFWKIRIGTDSDLTLEVYKYFVALKISRMLEKFSDLYM